MTIDAALPGADLVARGLADLEIGRESAESWLVRIGAPRLRTLGVDVPETASESPELRLYALLCAEGWRDAHSRYNALIRRLVSFERALELEWGRRLRERESQARR